MKCGDPTRRDGGHGDRLELVAGERPFDLSATEWLVGQGVRYLNTDDDEGKIAYQRAVEILLGRPDTVETITQLVRRVSREDAPLRWSLLYVLGDVADPTAGEFLVRLSIERLAERDDQQGCEGPRDAELLVHTMAVEALQRIATRHPQAAEHLLRIVSERPARPILIEAVKAARDLGMGEKLRDLLPQDDHWMLGIRRAQVEEIRAEPQRQDGPERGFTPPKRPPHFTAPQAGCCCPPPDTENYHG